MTPTRLRSISIVVPASEPQQRAAVDGLIALLHAVRGAQVADSRLVLAPQQPAAAWPVLALQGAAVATPALVFEMPQPLDLAVGGVRLYASGAPPRDAAPSPVLPTSMEQRMSLDAVIDHLAGRVVRVDHLGINLPSALVPAPVWEHLVATVAAAAALYRYPTGQAWPFIVPATDTEYVDDIHDFLVGREPRFELVYDTWSARPVLQLAIETAYSRAETEARFPAPYGLGLPGLEEYFRTIPVASVWPDLDLRLDLYYRSDGAASTWTTGEWLITEGGRIRTAG